MSKKPDHRGARWPGSPKAGRVGAGAGPDPDRLEQRPPRARPGRPTAPSGSGPLVPTSRSWSRFRPRAAWEPLPSPGRASGPGPDHPRPDLELSRPHIPFPRLHFSEVPRGERRPVRRPFLEMGKLRPEPGGGRQGHPERRAQRRPGAQGSPEDAPPQCGAVRPRLTSSTTRPSGCPSAPTSRYTSGFPAAAEGSRAPPPLQVRAVGRRSGEERATGRRPSRREPQRSASIATRVGGVGSGREIPGASGGNGREGHAHPDE